MRVGGAKRGRKEGREDGREGKRLKENSRQVQGYGEGRSRGKQSYAQTQADRYRAVSYVPMTLSPIGSVSSGPEGDAEPVYGMGGVPWGTSADGNEGLRAHSHLRA